MSSAPIPIASYATKKEPPSANSLLLDYLALVNSIENAHCARIGKLLTRAESMFDRLEALITLHERQVLSLYISEAVEERRDDLLKDPNFSVFDAPKKGWKGYE
jgi:hypothetical protein